MEKGMHASHLQLIPSEKHHVTSHGTIQTQNLTSFAKKKRVVNITNRNVQRLVIHIYFLSLFRSLDHKRRKDQKTPRSVPASILEKKNKTRIRWHRKSAGPKHIWPFLSFHAYIILFCVKESAVFWNLVSFKRDYSRWDARERTRKMQNDCGVGSDFISTEFFRSREWGRGRGTSHISAYAFVKFYTWNLATGIKIVRKSRFHFRLINS